MMTPLEVLRRYPPHQHTLESLFDSRARIDPSRPFLLCGGKTWSWGEFGTAAAALAAGLAARSIRKGDRFAIFAANSHAHPLLLFALARIGAILVPVNTDFGVAEAKYVMDHAGVAAVACSTATLEVARQACRDLSPAPWFVLVDGETPGVPRFDDLAKNAREAPSAGTPDDPCAIIYSSGTTGFPKGVMHSQRNYVLATEVHVGRTHLQPGGRVLCTLPMFHINALFYSLGSAVAAGASLAIEPRFSASRFWRTVADFGITHTTIMASVSPILARRPREEFVPGHRLGVVNGSGFTEETMRIFKTEFGVPTVIEGYGMTEIPASLGNPFEGPHKLNSMGKPCVHPDPKQKWIEVRVVDDEGRDVPDGTTGELVVRHPAMMLGYYRDPGQTTASYRDDWFLTGDLVRREPDGYFYFVARKKDIIRRRGENIAGAELDRVIGQHPGVAEAAAVAVPADIGGDEIMAVVVAKPGATLSAKEIRDWCAGRLAAHKIPRFVVFADSLPHTATHKVAKFLLSRDSELIKRADDSAVHA